MPRIAATLSLFGLVVLALGLNMAKFPIQHLTASPTADFAEFETLAAPLGVPNSPPLSIQTTSRNSEKLQQALATANEQETQAKNTQAPMKTGNSTLGDPEALSDDQPAEEPPECRPPECRPPECRPSGCRPIGCQASLENKTEPVAEEMSASAPSSGDPPEDTTPRLAGEIYNPLEPQPESGPPQKEMAETQHQERIGSEGPITAVSGPPYAGTGSPSATEGRIMVTIEEPAERSTQETEATEQLIRLPPVDIVWPGVSVEQPLGHDRLPVDDYPKTETP